MTQYILAKARNTRTGQTVKQQDLSGRRLGPHERRECQLLANRLAEQMTARGPDTWVAIVEAYTL